jgi:hypothetical protein
VIRRPLRASDVAEAPYLVWNAFVDLLATSEYADLTPKQRVAHLAFWYDSEVQNGGHYQYFENSAGGRCIEAVNALGSLGLERQASVLHRAVQVWKSRERSPAATAEEFVENALEDEFRELDAAYHECTPTIVEALDALLREHRDEFVVVEDSS